VAGEKYLRMNIFSQGFCGFFAEYGRVFYEYNVDGYGLELAVLKNGNFSNFRKYYTMITSVRKNSFI
jgi:hypothetical protein